MRRPTVSFESFDVVVVPFPFTDRQSDKRRPALVISDRGRFNLPAQHSVMAMITSAAADKTLWPLDTAISDLAATGLPVPSLVRMKLFTLDHRLVLRRCGQLAAADRSAVSQALSRLLPPARA